MLRRGSLLAAIVFASPLVGCIGRSEVPLVDAGVDAGDDAGVEMDAGAPPIDATKKLDVLLVVDNSTNTDVQQELLALTVPYLTHRLTNPPCVNGLGNVVAWPSSPTDACATGIRDFKPIRDFHVGVISTSIGGHGADVCSPVSPSWDPMQDDRAHLLSRVAGGGTIATYQDQGFLAWDPDQKLVPPGENDLPTITQKLQTIVRGAGSNGCGFESQLESIYRFLVDPSPYDSIQLSGTTAIPTGVDQALLAQRGDFLRPDSAVVVVLLTDENDCSTREGAQFYLSNQIQVGGQAFHLPRPRAECAKSPTDPCCASCGAPQPPGCAPDPTCGPPLSPDQDPVNLRCFDQKRRFGIDFLFPVDRYVKGFTSAQIANRQGELVDNPLYASNRSPKLVFFEGIVGVPWQDIAQDPKSISLGLLPGDSIDWSLVLGDPANGVAPADPLMIESIAPRTGTNPPTKTDLAPPSASIPLANPINGHERTIATGDDLQYACIYARPMPRDCATLGPNCDCAPASTDTNPLCQAPDGSYSTVQRENRALPAIRELSVLSALGPQAIVGSICAPNTSDPASPTFAYQPAVDALLHAVRRAIAP